ncbi:hypothetical protein ACR780_10625 [Sphingobacterium faecium]|uniref:hypothetical protein n=1 Tax=Sphingobacterium faecium TaxID=34087 RepID=UPI003DA55A33
MPEAKNLEFYNAYVVNVKDFLIAEKEIKRTINSALKKNKNNTVNVQTKIYALLYSTYSESSFMKMILTPHGFEQKYIVEILKQGSIQEKWYKTIELAFLKFNLSSKGSEVPNKIQELKKIILEFVVNPSVIRNKIAHGQFSIALNSYNTALNNDLSQKIEDLNVVYIYRLFEINKKLVAIIEDLIESPDKAHYAQYYAKYQFLIDYINKSKSWTVESKIGTKSMSKKSCPPQLMTNAVDHGITQ